MIQPISDSEKLLFATLRIISNGKVGTGFIFNFSNNSKSTIFPVLITNKHVISEKEQTNIETFIHIGSSDLKSVTDESIKLSLNSDWVFHPSEDLACTPLQPLFDLIPKKLQKSMFFRNLDEDLIYNDTQLKELNTIEDVVMIGYPNGIYDTKNNFPVIRKGITASHPATDYLGKNRGLIDMSCIAGSSGSPILIYNEGVHTNKIGETRIGGRRILLGVLVEAYYQNIAGDIIVEEIPTQQISKSVTRIPINLGIYIKAEELLVLKKEFVKKYNLDL